MSSSRDLTFEDLTGGPSSVGGPPTRDFLTSLIQFVERAITLTKEISNLLVTTKSDLIPMISQKVISKFPGPELTGQSAPTNPEALYNQIMEALNKILATFGDLKISELIQKMTENKQLVLISLKPKLAGT